jgi:hypothetical protein
MKPAFIFAGTFLLGALLALAARTARHDPHAGYAPTAASAPASTAPADHTGHAMPAPPAPLAASSSGAPVNTVCAICGMQIDPKLPTLEYQGQRIGFGCRMCPPKFKAEPDKYGPFYLRNEVIPR